MDRSPTIAARQASGLSGHPAEAGSAAARDLPELRHVHDHAHPRGQAHVHDQHDHAGHRHGDAHDHAHAPARHERPAFSLMALSAAGRLGLALPVVALLWALVFWAMGG